MKRTNPFTPLKWVLGCMKHLKSEAFKEVNFLYDGDAFFYLYKNRKVNPLKDR